MVEHFGPFKTARLQPLPLTAHGIKLKAIRNPALGLFGDHVVGEVAGRERFAARVARGKRGDATKVVIGKPGTK